MFSVDIRGGFVACCPVKTELNFVSWTDDESASENSRPGSAPHMRKRTRQPPVIKGGADMDWDPNGNVEASTLDLSSPKTVTTAGNGAPTRLGKSVVGLGAWLDVCGDVAPHVQSLVRGWGSQVRTGT
jgi:hypothetical protein